MAETIYKSSKLIVIGLAKSICFNFVENRKIHVIETFMGMFDFFVRGGFLIFIEFIFEKMFYVLVICW
jgi:hypothetical protein